MRHPCFPPPKEVGTDAVLTLRMLYICWMMLKVRIPGSKKIFSL